MANNSSSSSSSTGGIGFAGLLTIVFITLKLTHFINWSWWWILAPLWIPFGIAAAFGLVWLLCTILLAVIRKREYAKKVKANQPTFMSDVKRR